MSDDNKPPESERAVTETLGEVSDDQVERATADARSHPAADAAREAMEDPARHEDVPFDNRESNPGSTGPEGLEGDLGASSARTTAQHRRTDDARDVSPGSYDAPDVAADEAGPEAEDYENKSWGGTMRVSGEPRPAPIEDEKSRRENVKPE
jgi:hypothetical protein